MTGTKILDEITLNVQLISTSCLPQNFSIEPPCMFNLSVFHVWFKKFGWNHPVCLICLYLMSGSKLVDGITLYVQLVSTSYLVQNFWMESPCMFKLSVLHVWLKAFKMETPCMFNLFNSCLVKKCWIESPCMLNLSVLRVWFKTFVLNHPVCSTCLFFLFDSKLLDGIFLYVQFVHTSCLVQNLDWITLYVQFVSTSYLVQKFWMESPCMFNLSVLHDCLKFFWMEPPCMFNLSVFHVWFKTWMESHYV